MRDQLASIVRRYWDWRLRQRRGGEFTVAEQSDRATHVTAQWESRWPGAEPMGHLLRRQFSDRWVRFHSLPESKRYADNDEERAEIVRRDRQLLQVLVDSSASETVHLIGEDFDRYDTAGGMTKRHLAEAWPWRTYFDSDDLVPGERISKSYFWVSLNHGVESLDRYLRLAADDEMNFVVTDRDMTWIFAPYDGGVDIIAPDVPFRDALEVKFTSWRPSNEEGL